MAKCGRAMYGVAIAAVIFFPAFASAGMPAPLVLKDVAGLRLDIISFFLFLLFISALGVKLLWNGLRTTFPRLPRINYFRALALVILWSLLFIVLLAMISGARELMTPGAWERNGATYKLKNAEK